MALLAETLRSVLTKPKAINKMNTYEDYLEYKSKFIEVESFEDWCRYKTAMLEVRRAWLIAHNERDDLDLY